MADSVEAMLNQTEPFAITSSFEELLPILQWLDQLLEKAVTAAQIAYGAAAADDPYRGLHLTPEDVEQLLNREPGVPPFQIDAEPDEYRLSNLVSDRPSIIARRLG